MKLSKGLLMILSLALMLIPASPAFAGGMAESVISCFPPAPAGYEAEDVEFDLLGGGGEKQLGRGLVPSLEKGGEIIRYYQGEQSPNIRIVGKGMESFRFALAGRNPTCEVTEVAGRKAVIMYESMLAVPVKDKLAVLFEGDDDWPDTKKVLLILAAEFDYAKLESLIK